MADHLIDSKGNVNVEAYNKKLQEQRYVFSKIDAAMAILEKLPSISSEAINSEYSFSLNAFGFLFEIIKLLGVREDTLKEWITTLLVIVLPEIEVGVKATLLSNVKALISCNSDPRIPLRLRKRVSDSVYRNIVGGNEEIRGIDIDIDSIDPNGILNLSPFTEPGSNYYFGCFSDSLYEDDDKTARLVRADDFNAFLWYVIHKGNRQSPLKTTITDSAGIKVMRVEGDLKAYTITSSNSSLLGAIDVKPQDEEKTNIIEGNTFYDENHPNNISICIKTRFDINGVPTGNTIVPISSDWYSCNWYVDKSNYYSSNLGYKKFKQRNYSKELGICNLRYFDRREYHTAIRPTAPNNVRFSILPKPYVLLPTTVKEQVDGSTAVKVSTQKRFIKLLFNAEGEADQNGKFSLISETYNSSPTLTNKNIDGDYVIYDVMGIRGNEHIQCTKLKVNTKNGEYMLSKEGTFKESYKCALVECYPGLTIYEFNYDYIMGMKLFDPKVVCEKLLYNSLNPAFNTNFLFTLNKVKDNNKYPYFSDRQRVIELITNILEKDEEINDCFYAFSNEKYDKMLKKTEELKYRQMPYRQNYNEGQTVDLHNVESILNSLSNESTLEEQKDVINKAITTTCAILDNRENITALSDKSTTKVDFLTNILQQLVATVVDSILSPKVLMLLTVNQSLMNGYEETPLNADTLFLSLKAIIVALVREVRDLILKKLLDFVLEYLAPIKVELMTAVLNDQIASYRNVIKLLLDYQRKTIETAGRINSIISSFSSKDNKNESDIDLPSVLDNVNYADIYDTEPTNNNPVNINC